MRARHLGADRSKRALARAIRQARAERALTQEELAFAAEMHSTEVSHIEHGKRNPTYTTLLRISRGLKIPLARLVERAEELERVE